MPSKVISARMDLKDLAKALDGLITKDIDPLDRCTISQILKLTFYYGIIHLCKEPKSPASQESIAFIMQKFDKTKKD